MFNLLSIKDTRFSNVRTKKTTLFESALFKVQTIYSQKYKCKKYFYYTSTKPRKFDLHKLSIKLTRISILHTEYGYPAAREKANFIIRFQKYIKMQMMVCSGGTLDGIILILIKYA